MTQPKLYSEEYILNLKLFIIKKNKINKPFNLGS